jgi:nitrate reductase gamma subunit
MDTEGLLAFARGPLFALTFLIMLLGLMRHVMVQGYLLFGTDARHQGAGWRRILADSAAWLVPVRHLVRGTLLLTAASFLFHIAVIVPALFYEGHILLWEGYLGVNLPALGAGVADALTLLALVCGLLLLGYRVVVRRARALSSGRDYAVLLVTLLPFLTGYLAAHPHYSPLPWNGMLLLHVLSGELLFVTIPFSKLAHMVLFPFVRISPVYWHLQPGAGDQAARALFGRMGRAS